MNFFILIFLAVISTIHFYIWRRLVKNTRLKQPFKTIATLVIVALAISIPATFMVSRAVSFDVAKTLTMLPLLWMGTMFLILSFLFITDIFFLARFIFLKLSPSGTENQNEPADLSKRDALRKIAAAGTLGISGTLTTASFANVQRDAAVIHKQLALSKLPLELNGFRIVQLSDIHMGMTIDSAYLSRIVAQVNQLSPDIVVITGDLIDGYVNGLGKELSPLEALHATQGIYFVTGNHEYYFRAHEWVKYLSEMGIQVLDNRSVEIGSGPNRFLLAGVNDYQASRMPGEEGPRLDKALFARRPEQEVILLCHQPKVIYDAAAADVGLILSGHTHGGQIWPFNYLVRLQQPYLKGLVNYNDRTMLYINQGTGYWGPPMRLGTVSEISLFTLRRKES